MYLYQRTGRYFAQVADDIKGLAEAELTSLGAAEPHPVYRGIHFSAEQHTLYDVNLRTRLISRVLAPLVSFKCHSTDYLYRKASEIAWQDFLTPEQTFAVFATVTHSAIRHSKYAALRLKDAVADYFRENTGQRPSVDTREPDVWLNLHIQNNEATISLDASGGSLHRRGYRMESVEAPMVETLAAAILRLSEWDAQTPLVDPFCGSGTLLCEAYLLAAEMPPAILRDKFGFEQLPDFDASLWQSVRQKAAQQIKAVPPDLISGSDVSPEAVSVARENCAGLDRAGVITVKQQDIFDIDSLSGVTIACNPPYGIRMGKGEDLSDFYRRFGDFLKQRCTGSTAYIYFGERKYLKRIGLRATWKKPLSTGGLDGRLAKYELWE